MHAGEAESDATETCGRQVDDPNVDNATGVLSGDGNTVYVICGTLTGPLLSVRVNGGGTMLLRTSTVPILFELKTTLETLMIDVVIGGTMIVVTTVDDV